MTITQSVCLSLEGGLLRGLGSNAQATQKRPALPGRLRTGPCPIGAAEHCCPLPTRPALLPKASHPPWPLQEEQGSFRTSTQGSTAFLSMLMGIICILPSCLAYYRSAHGLSQQSHFHSMPRICNLR